MIFPIDGRVVEKGRYSGSGGCAIKVHG
jgi:hypothetical protein